MPLSCSPFHVHDWTVLRGDTEHTPRFALIFGDGSGVDLAEWTLRAQVRRASDDALVHTFADETGIVLGTATVVFSDGRDPVTASTARLRLNPPDYAGIWPRARLRYDLEGVHPTRTRTFFGGELTVLEDVTQ